MKYLKYIFFCFGLNIVVLLSIFASVNYAWATPVGFLGLIFLTVSFLMNKENKN